MTSPSSCRTAAANTWWPTAAPTSCGASRAATLPLLGAPAAVRPGSWPIAALPGGRTRRPASTDRRRGRGPREQPAQHAHRPVRQGPRHRGRRLALLRAARPRPGRDRRTLDMRVPSSRATTTSALSARSPRRNSPAPSTPTSPGSSDRRRADAQALSARPASARFDGVLGVSCHLHRRAPRPRHTERGSGHSGDPGRADRSLRRLDRRRRHGTTQRGPAAQRVEAVGSDSAVTLIIGGRGYPVPDKNSRAALGYKDVPAAAVTASLIGLLPPGLTDAGVALNAESVRPVQR